MDKQHKQVITTSPVAIKSGQGRVHVPNPIPWHPDGGAVKCPKCETIYVLTQGFPTKMLLDALEAQHKRGQQHPDYFASDPAFTRTEDCDCSLVLAKS